MLNHLDYFRTVAQYENMTKAAEKLFVSQPALSMTIMKLEESIGTPLFDRDGRKIRLNPAGKLLLKFAENSEAELALVLTQINQLNKPVKPIKLGLTCYGHTKDIIQHFKILKGISVKVVIDDHQTIERKLLSGEIDLAISLPQIDNSKLTSLLLLEDRLHVIVPTQSELYSKKTLTLDDLKKATFWGLPEDHPYRIFIDGLLAKKGVHLNYITESTGIMIRNIVAYPHLAIIHHPPSLAARNSGLSHKLVEGFTEKRPVSLQYLKDNVGFSEMELITFIQNNYYKLYRTALEKCESI